MLFVPGVPRGSWAEHCCTSGSAARWLQQQKENSELSCYSQQQSFVNSQLTLWSFLAGPGRKSCLQWDGEDAVVADQLALGFLGVMPVQSTCSHWAVLSALEAGALLSLAGLELRGNFYGGDRSLMVGCAFVALCLGPENTRLCECTRNFE